MMNFNELLINTLNKQLADGLTAVNHLKIHLDMCNIRGNEKLRSNIEKQTVNELLKTEWLIHRINFLGGTPIVSDLNQMKIDNIVTENVSKNR